MIKGLLHKPIVHILLIVVLGILAYSNTFNVPFHFDDKLNIVNNPIIKDLRYFVEPSMAQEFRGSFHYHAFKDRYIGFLTLALNYRVHGLDVTGYHIVNLLIHIINALLVYLLVLLTFKTPVIQRITSKSPQPPFNKGGNKGGLIALFSALLFISHPIQTQAVTYIVQRLASLATLFYLLSIVMYIKARLSFETLDSRPQTQDSERRTRRLKPAATRYTLYAISLFSAVLAMKTKEMAFTLPVIIVLYEFMFLDGKFKRRIIYLIPLLLTMLIIPLCLIGMDKPIGDLIGDVSEATWVQKTMSRLDYLFTEFRVIVTYIRLIFLPINQNLDYDYPLYYSLFSLFNLEVFLSFMFLLTILGSGVYLFYRYRDSVTHTRLIAFGIFWFFVTLSVESSIIPLHVIFEHRMYLPSIGVFVVMSAFCFMVVEKLKDRWVNINRTVVVVLLLIVIILTGATYVRNIVWKDKVSLWKDVVSKSPENARAHNNLGVAYKSKGFVDEAIKHLQIATKLDPNYRDAHYNLGNAYQSERLIDRAIKQYQVAIKLTPDFSNAHINLGNAYQSQGLIDKAIKQYQVAIKLTPHIPLVYYNLGNAYQSQGLINKAVEQYRIAIKLNPNIFDAHYNLGLAYYSQGLIDKAIQHYLIAIKLNPDYLHAYINLGVAYRAQGLFDKAEEIYKAAIRFKPEWEVPHFNLGVVYLKKEDTEKARREFEKVLQINPKNYKALKFLNSIIQRNDNP